MKIHNGILLLAALGTAVAPWRLGAESAPFQPSFAVGATFAKACDGFQQTIVADFNGDHKPDMAVYCSNGESVSVLLGNGDGTFKSPVVTTLQTTLLEAIIAADLNGDGKADLIYAATTDHRAEELKACTGDFSIAGIDRAVAVSLSTGNGAFGPPVVVDTQTVDKLWGTSDLNSDGLPDLILVNGGFYIDIMWGQPGGTFSPLQRLKSSAGQCWSEVLAVRDFNNDGKADIVAGSRPDNQSGFGDANRLVLLANQGNGVFTEKAFLTDYPNQSLSSGVRVSVSDFDGDGKLDIVAAKSVLSNPSSSLLIFRGNGDTTFQAPKPPPNVFSSTLFVVDANNDGRSDLVQKATDGPIFYFSNADGTVQAAPAVTGYHDFDVESVADFNGDGRADLVVGSALGVHQVLLNTSKFVADVRNGASFAIGQALTPGELASAGGYGLGQSPLLADSIPLPLSLGGVSVTVGGFDARLQYVSSNQINFQVPWEVQPGKADIVVKVNNAALPAFHANIAAEVPGIFTVQSGIGQAIAINPDGSLAGPEGSIPGLPVHPAVAGDPLIILCTGLGLVQPAIDDGAAASDALRNAVDKPEVLIGDVPATVQFAGLSPQFVGVNQINVIVPQVAKAGVLPIQIKEGSLVTSNQVTIAVANP